MLLSHPVRMLLKMWSAIFELKKCWQILFFTRYRRKVDIFHAVFISNIHSINLKNNKLEILILQCVNLFFLQFICAEINKKKSKISNSMNWIRTVPLVVLILCIIRLLSDEKTFFFWDGFRTQSLNLFPPSTTILPMLCYVG